MLAARDPSTPSEKLKGGALKVLLVFTSFFSLEQDHTEKLRQGALMGRRPGDGQARGGQQGALAEGGGWGQARQPQSS